MPTRDRPSNAVIEDLVKGMPHLPQSWDHLVNGTLSQKAEEEVSSRSCGDRIWMLGPGSAGLLEAIHSRAGAHGSVLVLDSSWEVLNWTMERALERNLVSLDVRHRSRAAFPLTQDKVDLIVAALSLHHEPALAATLADIARVLVPSGRLPILDVDRLDGRNRLACGARPLPAAELRRALKSPNLASTAPDSSTADGRSGTRARISPRR